RITKHTDTISSVAFSPDGRYALTASRDSTIRLWSLTDGQEVRRLEGYAPSVESVALSSDGRHILTGDSDNTARLWDSASGGIEDTFGRSSADTNITSVAFSSDGARVLTGSSDGTARLWDVQNARELRYFRAASLKDAGVLSGKVLSVNSV